MFFVQVVVCSQFCLGVVGGVCVNVWCLMLPGVCVCVCVFVCVCVGVGGYFRALACHHAADVAGSALG